MDSLIKKVLTSLKTRLDTSGSIIQYDKEASLALETWGKLLEICKDVTVLEDNIPQEDPDPALQRIYSHLRFYAMLPKVSETILSAQLFEKFYNKVSTLTPFDLSIPLHPKQDGIVFVFLIAAVNAILDTPGVSEQYFQTYIETTLNSMKGISEKTKKVILKYLYVNYKAYFDELVLFGNTFKDENELLPLIILKRVKLKRDHSLKKAGDQVSELLQDKKTGRVFKWQEICADPTQNVLVLKDLVPFDTTGLTKREICKILAEQNTATPACEEMTNLEGDTIPNYRLYTKEIQGKIYCYDLFDLHKLLHQDWDPYHRFKLDKSEIQHKYNVLVQTMKRSALNNTLDNIASLPIETSQSRLQKVWFRFRYPIPLETFMNWDLVKYGELVIQLEASLSEKQLKVFYFALNERNRKRIIDWFSSILDTLTESNSKAAIIEQLLHAI